MADLSARLRALEERRGVLETLYRYGHAIDYGAEDDWVDCFTEDAVYDVHRGEQTGRSSESIRCEGRAEIAAFVSRHSRAPEAWHKHMLSEPMISIEGERARAVSYFARLDHGAEGPYLRAFGRYRDRLVRCSDGRWRFEARVAEVESTQPRRDAAGSA